MPDSARLCIALTLALTFFAPAAIAGQPHLETLYRFKGAADGAQPNGGLVIDASGNIYGTTQKGGHCSDCGGVFSLPADTGPLTELHQFNGADGGFPLAGLTVAQQNLAAAAVLFGATSGGGNANGGVAFTMTPAGAQTKETPILTFGVPGSSTGLYPSAAMILDVSGNGVLYGTTRAGGAHSAGTVFSLTPPPEGSTTWTESVLHSFCSVGSCSDGFTPLGPVAQGPDGALYGTTTKGGANSAGTVFKLKGGTFTVLHDFCSDKACGDGASPAAAVTFDADGAVYGTTATTVWRVNADGSSFTVLHAFCGHSPCTDGSNAVGGLTADAKGNLYGVTSLGGKFGGGTIYKLTPSFNEAVVFNFAQRGRPQPSTPAGGLFFDPTTNALFGATIAGGHKCTNTTTSTGYCGTIFKLTL